MKLLKVCLALMPFYVTGQGFNLRFDYDENLEGEAIWNIELLEEGYLIIGGAEDSAELNIGIWSMILDFQGTKQFEALFETPMTDYVAGWANSTAPTSENNYIMGGGTWAGFYECYLALFNTNGDTIWTRTYGDPVDSTFYTGRCAIQTPDGGYLLAGETNENGTTDGLLIKTDENGNELWREFYGEDYYNQFVSVVNTTDGGFLAGGERRETETSDTDSWVAKTNNQGVLQWEIFIDGFGFDEMDAHLLSNENGTYMIAGGLGTEDNGDSASPYPFIRKINSSGGEIWSNTYGMHFESTGFTSIKHVPGGGYIAAGISTETLVNYEGLLLRIEENGDSLWMRRYHWLEGNNCFFRDVIPSENGGFVACGLAYPDSEMGLSLDGWVVKTDEYGCVIPGCNVGIVEQDEVADFLIYPNPASTVTNIYLQTKDMGLRGEFVLRDLAGRELVRHATLGGDINIGMDVSRYQAGMYVVEFVVEGRIVKYKKLVVN